MKSRYSGRMKDVKATNPLDFPKTTGTTRIITKHFTNLCLTLHRDTLSLLAWLIYQTNSDNTIIYTTKLLRQYQESVNQVQSKYEVRKIARSLPSSRRNFSILIELGILTDIENKTYFLSPNLTFHRYFVKAEFWQKWVIDPKATPEQFINHARAESEKRSESSNRYRKAA